MKQIGVIINPSSAGGRTRRVWPDFESLLQAGGFAVTAYTSASETDFRVHARAFARRFETIGICGGDSSLTIAAQELVEHGFRGELFFLPAGSVNDIVLDIREQRARKSESLWLGDLKLGKVRRQFIGQANWGLGVAVNRQVGNTLQKMPFLRPLQGLIGFLSISWNHLLRRECVTARIQCGDHELSGEFSIILTTQIRHWATGLRFAPAADWYSPHLQLVTVRRCGLIKLIRIILAARHGRHTNFPEVQICQGRNISLAFAQEVPVQIDGDILREHEAELTGDRFEVGKRKTQFTLASAR